MTSTEKPTNSSSQNSENDGANEDLSPQLLWEKAYPEGVRWDEKLTPAPLPSILDRAVIHYGDSISTNFLGKKLTYAEIGYLVNRAAKGLQNLGVSRGVKVGLFLPNCPTFIIFYYAVLKAGATVVNYNPLYSIEELTFQVEDSETQLMVTLDLKILFNKVETLLEKGVLGKAVICSFSDLLPMFKGELFSLFKRRQLAKTNRSKQAQKLINLDDLLINGGDYTRFPIDPEKDIAVLQYTGGTTGTPKGAMLTHANLAVNHQQISLWTNGLVNEQERVMGILPLFHVFAMTTVMNFGIAKAAELILVPKFELLSVLKLITRTRPTIMPGVPTLFKAIIRAPKLEKYDFSSLNFCISGGAPLPIEVKREFETLTGCKLVEGYGLSETSPVATCNPIEGPVKEGSIGLPLPQTTISLRSLEDPEKQVALGEEGEICITGPQVMKGYWKRPEETANAFVGEFFRSGDVATIDEDGFFYIVDRIKDLILCSGYNVYPRRIEEMIYEYPGVEEVIVIGVPDAYRGEAPKAFIKLKSGEHATDQDILTFLKLRLAKIELPEEIEFRDELPKTMIGKLSKKELREAS